MRSTFGGPRVSEQLNGVERRPAGVLVDHRRKIGRLESKPEERNHLHRTPDKPWRGAANSVSREALQLPTAPFSS
jgi:hypothetical protein